jgi:hypothetical protein
MCADAFGNIPARKTRSTLLDSFPNGGEVVLVVSALGTG